MKITSVFGPPGTGKTTYLSKVISSFKDSNSIAVLSFTRAAAKEISSRSDKVNFSGTIHSMCFKMLGMSKSQVIDVDEFIEFYSDEYNKEEIMIALHIGGLSVKNCTPFEYELDKMGSVKAMPSDYLIHHIWDSYVKWKKNNGVIDFDDMIINGAKGAEPLYDVVIVDEAQDISKTQWEVIRKVAKKEIIFAGDDDQAIFKWAGACPTIMVDNCDEQIILRQSHRIPISVHNYSQSIINQVKNRVIKEFNPTSYQGEVTFTLDTYPSMFEQPSTTVLFRDNYMINEVETQLIDLRIPYSIEGKKSIMERGLAKFALSFKNKDVEALSGFSRIMDPISHAVVSSGEMVDGEWYDHIDTTKYDPMEIDYIIDMMGKGDINDPVHLSTIHRYKGKEADNIILIAATTPMAEHAFEIEGEYEDEVRTWYVGATRSKKSLMVVGSNLYIDPA